MDKSKQMPKSSSNLTKGRQRTEMYNSPTTSRYFDASTSVLSLKFLLILIGLASFIVAIYIEVAKNLSNKFHHNQNFASSKHSVFPHQNRTVNNKVLIIADNLEAGYLDHVIEAFKFYNFELAFSQNFENATNVSNEGDEKDSLEDKASETNDAASETSIDFRKFDVIYAYDYPFLHLKNILQSQRVNHFPGIGFIANKVSLSTTPKLPNTLRAFRIPEEADKFIDFSETNPDLEWVEKTSSHRGIRITKASEVNLTRTESTIVQEFLSKPLLIDGKKFDIGIYVAITSMSPMRAYVYDQETLIRFCAKPYYYFDNKTQSFLFNSSDIDSYVVGDDYTPMWLMPSLLKYYIGTNLSMKETIKAYLKLHEKEDNPEHIWDQIETTIKHILKQKEIQVAKLTKLYQKANNYILPQADGSLGQFFELLRFDFIIDENLNVKLMEANMSPNLSSRHFPANKFIYNQVLRSYFSLIGLTESSARHLMGPNKNQNDNQEAATSFEPKRQKLDLIIDDKELSVYEELCTSLECHMNCSKPDCKICYFCLSDSDKLHIKRAIFEQKSKWNFKRILPSTKQADFALQLHNLPPDSDSEANIAHVQWFKGKCHSDVSYCNR